MSSHIQHSTNAPNLLKSHGLRVTEGRVEILSYFLNDNHALSHTYLEEKCKKSQDRVTIYRALYAFLEKGLIHKVLDEGGAAKYALCSTCSDTVHHHDHVHFKCDTCGQTYCLDTVQVPKLVLPQGYKIKETGILIQGVCDKCSK